MPKLQHLLLFLWGLASAHASINLQFLENGPNRVLDFQGNPVISGSPAPWWFNSGIVAPPVFDVMEGTFEDKVEVRIFCATVDAVILYTVEPDQAPAAGPRLDGSQLIGNVYDGSPVLVTRSSVVKAMAVHLYALDSLVSQTGVIYIRVKPPTFRVSSGVEGSLTVTISASSSEPTAQPYISIAFDQELPLPTDPQGIEQLNVTLVKSAIVRAIAFQDGLLPSHVASSGLISVQGLQTGGGSGFALAGCWDVGATGSFYGNYSRPRRQDGSCNEAFPTLIEPALVRECGGALGPLMLVGPSCKGGAWDVDPAGVSPCDFFPLVYHAADGYQGRAAKPLRMMPNCSVVGQPGLSDFVLENSGLSGMSFDGSLNRLLLLSQDVDELVKQQLLPTEAMTLELEVAFDRARMVRNSSYALLAAQQSSGNFAGANEEYFKGWALSYHTFSNHTGGEITLSFSIALEGNLVLKDSPTMAELQYTLPPPSDNHLSWWHLLLSYDLHTLRLFVNGSLAAQAQACPAPLDPLRGCGRILYPSSLDPQFKGPASFTVGGYEDGNMRISRSHQGMLKRIRLFAEALRLDVIRAAAQQMTLGAAVTPCSSGTFGVFAGMSPCSPCLAGTFNPLVGQEICPPCPQGFFSEVDGATICRACPVGNTTASPGAKNASECVEPNPCVRQVCDIRATCTQVPGSFTCTCLPGYAGDGSACFPICGDGLKQEEEACDDGNTDLGDGCSSLCTIEQGFVCSTSSTAGPSLSSCVCIDDEEICCARQFTNCMSKEGRFDSRGISSDGQDKGVGGGEAWVLAQSSEDCNAACARLLPGSSCLPHDGSSSLLSSFNVSLVDALLQAGESRNASCNRSYVLDPNHLHFFQTADLSALPMIDEFGTAGTRSFTTALPLASDGLVCYALEASYALAVSSSCSAVPSVASARRLCLCNQPPSACTADCLQSQQQCLAQAETRKKRVEAALVEYFPCLDNPSWFYSPTPDTIITCKTISDPICEQNIGSGCNECPNSCRSCGSCYEQRKQFYYGVPLLPITNTTLPGGLPQCPGKLLSDKCNGDKYCILSFCNKGLAECAVNGLSSLCSNRDCWGFSSAISTSCSFAKPGSVNDLLTCECLAWYFQCYPY